MRSARNPKNPVDGARPVRWKLMEGFRRVPAVQI